MASLITGIIGGFQGNSAISDASRAQIESYLKAAGIIKDTTAAENTQLQSTSNNANADLMAASEGAIGGVNDAVKAAQTGATTAANTANAGLDPYASAGGTAVTDLLSLLQDPSKFGQGQQFSFDPNADPGAAYRQQMQQKAIERSAAARGQVLGGSTLQSLAQRSQDLASQDYQAAFERFDKNRAASLAGTIAQMQGLSSLTGTGLQASTRQGANTIDAAQYGGNMGVGGAQWTGNMGVNTANTVGNRNMNVQGTIMNNNLNSANFSAQMALNQGNTEAQEHLGRANGWNNMLGSIGKFGDSFIAGGFGGGGGFNWGNAARGAAGLPRRTSTGGGMPGGQY
jgi:hypothetical protein